MCFGGSGCLGIRLLVDNPFVYVFVVVLWEFGVTALSVSGGFPVGLFL